MILRKERIHLMNDGQMELSFECGQGRPPAGKRARREGRANWWFERMRQVVDRAFDWKPSPPPRPEQIWFGATLPQGSGTGRRASDERQICE
jgi:hypothetical protein